MPSLDSHLKTSARPRVLAITSEVPWPLNTGGHLRSFHLMRIIARHFALRLVTVLEDGQQDLTSHLTEQGIRVIAARAPRRNAVAEAGRVVSAALANEPYVMFHRHNRPALRAAVQEALHTESADLIYLDHLDSYALRPMFPAARILVDLHNRYGLLAQRVAEEHGGVKGWYLRHQARQLEASERRAVTDANGVTAVSAEEQHAFEALGARSVTLVPNGVDCSRYAHLPVGRHSQSPVLMYLGALSWPPNATAATYLAKDVMPAVLQSRPDARLWLVGRNPTPAVEALGALPGVEVHANVPDVEVFLAGATALIVPLDAGGGTRLKILEAFAAGLPVISTAIGVEGIDVRHGVHLWIAERESIARAVLDVFADPEAAARRAVEARALVNQQYDWTAIGERACDAIAAALQS